MRRRPVLVLVPFALLFLVVGLVEAWRDSPTVDEAVDIASGVTSLVRHDLRLNPEHGLLTRVLPALPALAAHPIVPNGPGYQSGDWFDHTDEFVRANEAAGRFHLVLFMSRIVPLLEALGVAGLIYVLGARLFGEWPGVLGAGLWLTTPVFVGFGHVGSIDIAFALVTLLVSLALLSYLEKASDRRALWLGLALCAALLTRHIALVLLAVGVIVVVAHSWRAARRTAFRHAGIVAGVAWAGVWVAFRVFSPTGTGGAAGERLSGIISAGRGDSALVRVALAVPWPKEWAAGLAFGVLSTANQPAYLLGQSWTGGKWWFFLGSLVVKLPLIALVVLVVGPFAWRKVPHEARVKAFIVLVVPAVALYVAITAQALDRGLRYAFPIAALWFVAAGPIALLGTPTWRRVGAAVLVATQLAAFTVAFPHSIAWTPPPFQPGYRWASDSNIDFSQDTRLVDEWADGREPLVDLLLPRGFDPPPGSRPLLDVEPSDVRGWVAVSATRLTELDRDELSWLRAYCPVDTIGGSVLIYRFDGPVDATPGPTMPAAECDGEVSVRTD